MVRRPRTRARSKGLLRFSAVVLGGAIGAWLGGLFWFASQVPLTGPAPEGRTDAIVVLTGGSERLDTGLRLLIDGYAKKVFVSGVARGVDMAALLRVARRSPDDVVCCIAIGYRADNTAGNARETASWMRAQGYRSLRLVTASYHMPRSLLEFRRAMPDTTIVPHPVFPPQFKRENWWLWPGTATLLSSEFTKYLLARVTPAMSGNGEATP